MVAGNRADYSSDSIAVSIMVVQSTGGACRTATGFPAPSGRRSYDRTHSINPAHISTLWFSLMAHGVPLLFGCWQSPDSISGRKCVAPLTLSHRSPTWYDVTITERMINKQQPNIKCAKHEASKNQNTTKTTMIPKRTPRNKEPKKQSVETTEVIGINLNGS
jgi:hypothetical protein